LDPKQLDINRQNPRRKRCCSGTLLIHFKLHRTFSRRQNEGQKIVYSGTTKIKQNGLITRDRLFLYYSSCMILRNIGIQFSVMESDHPNSVSFAYCRYDTIPILFEVFIPFGPVSSDICMEVRAPYPYIISSATSVKFNEPRRCRGHTVALQPHATCHISLKNSSLTQRKCNCRNQNQNE